MSMTVLLKSLEFRIEEDYCEVKANEVYWLPPLSKSDDHLPEEPFVGTDDGMCDYENCWIS